MSSDPGIQNQTGEGLQVTDGEQVAVLLDPVDQPLDVLPNRAFEKLLVVTSTATVALERQLHERGVDTSGIGVVPVSSSPVSDAESLSAADAVPPEDLTGLSVSFVKGTEALPQERGWILFDAVDVLFMLNDEKRAIQFVEHVTNRARNRALRTVLPVVRDSLDDPTYSRLRRSVDRVVDERA